MKEPRYVGFERRVLDKLGVGAEIYVPAVRDPQARKRLSAEIQCYLGAQRRGNTRYVLKRRDRTKAAVWSIGERVADARLIAQQFGDDMKHRINAAVMPDISHIATLTPQSRKAIEEALQPAIQALALNIESLIAGQLVNGEV